MQRLLGLFTLSILALSPVSAAAQEGFEERSFTGSNNLTLPYRLFKPSNIDPDQKYPLILFLHGAGERGDDNSAQISAGNPNGAVVWTLPENQAKNPAYVIAPQCPAGEQWVDWDWSQGSYSTEEVPVSDELTVALELFGAVAEEFGTDASRHYITGLSMGGFGTWDAIVRNPDLFAAAIPICGAGDPSRATDIAHLPIWTFHGDADNVVPVEGTREMFMALMQAGSDVRYDEYPGVGHNAWDPTYQNQAVIDWLFQQSKPEPPAGGAGGGGGASAGLGGMGGLSMTETGGSAATGTEPDATAGGSVATAFPTAMAEPTSDGPNVTMEAMLNPPQNPTGGNSGCGVAWSAHQWWPLVLVLGMLVRRRSAS